MRLTLRLEILTLFTFYAVFGDWGMSYGAGQEDLDRDGLKDQFEQEMLVRFLPEFKVSQTECAGLPAKFLPESPHPQPVALNGTIYGQVFPVALRNTSGSFLEIHYYHLWSRDCGRLGHDLDAEHVSVLVQADGPEAPASRWKSLYWYAAAHEGTLCDASNGARVPAFPGHGPGMTIWISAGKHASFLTQDLCSKVGCGGDQCKQMIPFSPSEVINLGEPGAPLNGAVWTASKSWPLADKMKSDFGDSVRPRLELLEESEAAFIGGAPPPTKALLLAGNKTIGAVDKGQSETGGALAITAHKTGSAVTRGVSEAGRSLLRSVKAVGSWLGLRIGHPADEDAKPIE
ncbi:MAG: hypothetical protein ACRD1R_13420 [Acidobacteriota bacterium]